MMLRTLRLIIVAAALVFLPACQERQESAPSSHDPDPSTVKQQLELLLADSDLTTGLNVEYNDMHSFHGGKTLTVNSDTLWAEYLLREGAGRRKVDSPPIILTSDQLRTLVSLLLEIEAWEQRVPNREPLRDESRAGLSIRLGTVESRIWEWYNDLSGNDRMVRVKQMLEAIVGPPPNG